MLNDLDIIKATKNRLKRKVKKMTKRQFSPEYKAKIVLEIMREENTVSEIGAREDISAKQLHNWKKEFIDNAAKVFSQKKEARDAVNKVLESEEREETLMAKVGQLTIEIDWLKKKIQPSLWT